MKEGQPTHDQLYKIIGSIYSDAYLRIEFLENENRQLRQDQQEIVASLQSSVDKLREERENLQKQILQLQLTKKDVVWTSGNGNSMLPESLLEKLASKSTGLP